MSDWWDWDDGGDWQDQDWGDWGDDDDWGGTFDDWDYDEGDSDWADDWETDYGDITMDDDSGWGLGNLWEQSKEWMKDQWDFGTRNMDELGGMFGNPMKESSFVNPDLIRAGIGALTPTPSDEHIEYQMLRDQYPGDPHWAMMEHQALIGDMTDAYGPLAGLGMLPVTAGYNLLKEFAPELTPGYNPERTTPARWDMEYWQNMIQPTVDWFREHPTALNPWSSF
jgi:hypothetical protein